MEEKKFALLIDADNISSKYIKIIIEELSKYGTITYKRLYGDLTKSNNRSWKNAMLSHSINPVQQYNYTTGKNSTDSAMIIDAMDILYDLQKLPIYTEPQPDAQIRSRIFDLAQEYNLSFYDASYLELARRNGLELKTYDEELKKAL